MAGKQPITIGTPQRTGLGVLRPIVRGDGRIVFVEVLEDGWAKVLKPSPLHLKQHGEIYATEAAAISAAKDLLQEMP